MRVVFLGNDPWSVPSLDAVAASSHELVLAVTREPRPVGRGGKLRTTAVAEAARRIDAPLREVDTVKSGPGFAAIEEAAPDVLAVVAYGEILPREVLDLPKVAPVNVHFSLLPALRGANPVRRAILDGLDVTGVTTIRMDEGMDTGTILLQAEEPIRPDDDAESLGNRLATLGGELLVQTLDRLEAGDLEPTPQDDAAATLAPRFSPGDEWIDWTESADRIARLVRALAPDPGAKTRFRGKILKVLRARAEPGNGEPGSVVDPTGPTVAAGDGALALEEVLPEGKRRMTGVAFARGYRPEPGDLLG